MKRVVIPEALKILRMAPTRKFTLLGELAKEVGWGYTDLVRRLESQRKIKEQAYYADKKAKDTLRAKAVATADLSKVDPILSQYGFVDRRKTFEFGKNKAAAAAAAPAPEPAKAAPAAAPKAAAADY
jgi:hypothetical protein